MDKVLQEESDRLKQSWMQHDAAMLRDYLVSSVEDPRINLQSILTRHFLLRALFGQRFHLLMGAEFHFAAAMNWLLKFFKLYSAPEDAQALLHALTKGADNADGIEIPHFLLQLFHALPASVDGVKIPNYILSSLRAGPGPDAVANSLSTFQALWQKRLARFQPRNISVLEPACGSANDYRFLEAFGLARLLQYTGFDLCEKNVENARQLFPHADFRLGNVFQLDVPDKTFDYAFVHDLFEHLSLSGLETAVAEICRVVRSSLCIGFFNMDEEDDHRIQPVENYHWNRLSMTKTRELFRQHGCWSIQVIHIGTFLQELSPGAETHNENAYTFIALR